MDLLYSFGWVKKHVPGEIQGKNGNIAKIIDIFLTDPAKTGDITKYHNNPICLITGDGGTLPRDVKIFESWGIPHDLYCVNRSMIFFERQVTHWAAVDIEEALWFAENVTEKIEPDERIVRHTIGEHTLAFDVYWKMDPNLGEMQRRVLVGSSGYFAVLTALHMGYEKIVLAGMPLNFDPHWYDQPGTDGPMWGGMTYSQWIDFKQQHPYADKLRSMGEYSAFILGQATKEWVLNG